MRQNKQALGGRPPGSPQNLNVATPFFALGTYVTDCPGSQWLRGDRLEWGAVCLLDVAISAVALLFLIHEGDLFYQRRVDSVSPGGFPVLPDPGRMGSSLPVSSSSMLNPEPGVLWDTIKCTGSNDKNCRPVAEKGPFRGDGRKGSFPLLLARCFHQKLARSLDLLPRRPAEKQTWSLMADDLVLCVLSRCVAAITIHRLGKPLSRCVLLAEGLPPHPLSALTAGCFPRLKCEGRVTYQRSDWRVLLPGQPALVKTRSACQPCEVGGHVLFTLKW